MARMKKWMAVVGVMAILGVGAAVVLTRGSGNGKRPAPAAQSARTNLKPLTPAEVTQLVQGLLAKAQQAANTNGSKGISPSQASAIVNEQLKQLGVPALNNDNK